MSGVKKPYLTSKEAPFLTWRIESTRLIVGSSEYMDVQVRGDHVNPYHCEIGTDGKESVAVTRTGPGEVFVNGRAAEVFDSAADGDEIRIGNSVFEVSWRSPHDVGGASGPDEHAGLLRSLGRAILLCNSSSLNSPSYVSVLLCQVDDVRSLETRCGRDAVEATYTRIVELLHRGSAKGRKPWALGDGVFGILLFVESGKVAELSEEIRIQAHEELSAGDGSVLPVRVSIGVANSDRETEAPEIAARAIWRLQYAAERGGNRVCTSVPASLRVLLPAGDDSIVLDKGDGLVLGGEVTGRGRLSVDSVAPRHAAVLVRFDGFAIIDLGGGVLVNGRRVDEAALKEGDLVSLGDVLLRFSKGEEHQHAAQMEEDTLAFWGPFKDELRLGKYTRWATSLLLKGLKELLHAAGEIGYRSETRMRLSSDFGADDPVLFRIRMALNTIRAVVMDPKRHRRN